MLISGVRMARARWFSGAELGCKRRAVNEVAKMETKVVKTNTDIDSAFLTDKQVEVLQFVCDRRTNKEIALLLGISPSAVEQRLQSVRRKFGVHSRADLARAYDRAQVTSANITGAEYQVDTSIPDCHNPTKYSEAEANDLRDQNVPIKLVQASDSVVNQGLGQKSNILEVVDHASGLAGRVAVITTAAASIALLIILIAEVAPGLS